MDLRKIGRDDGAYVDMEVQTIVGESDVPDATSGTGSANGASIEGKLQAMAAKQLERHRKRMQQIRQRNATYSKTKYYKKKEFVDTLKDTKIKLLRDNQELRASIDGMERTLQHIHVLIALSKPQQQRDVRHHLMTFSSNHVVGDRGTVGRLPAFIPLTSSRVGASLTISDRSFVPPPQLSYYSTSSNTGSMTHHPQSLNETLLRAASLSDPGLSFAATLPPSPWTTASSSSSSSLLSSWRRHQPLLASEMLQQPPQQHGQWRQPNISVLHLGLLHRNGDTVGNDTTVDHCNNISDVLFHCMAAEARVLNDSIVSSNIDAAAVDGTTTPSPLLLLQPFLSLRRFESTTSQYSEHASNRSSHAQYM